MSIKIKVSYESPHELQEVLKRLKPILLSCKIPKVQEGRFKRAYICLKNVMNSEKRTVSEQRELINEQRGNYEK